MCFSFGMHTYAHFTNTHTMSVCLESIRALRATCEVGYNEKINREIRAPEKHAGESNKNLVVYV